MLFEMISFFPTLFPVATFYSSVEQFISLSFLSQIQLAWKAEVVSSRSFWIFKTALSNLLPFCHLLIEIRVDEFFWWEGKKTCISVVFHLRYLQDGNKCPGSWLLAFHSCSSVCSKYRVSDVERVADPSVIESDTGRDLASQRGLKPRDMGRVKERWSDGRSCRPLPRLALAPFATASHPVHGTASPV